MNRFCILFAGALAVATMSATPAYSPIKVKSHKAVAQKVRAAKPGRKAVATASAAVWRPGLQILSEWDAESSEWVSSAKYETKYDAAGNILTDIVTPLTPEGTSDENESAQRTTYEYNEFGMPVSRLVEVFADGEFVNYSKQVREYDPEAHDVIVANTESIWKDGQWSNIGNCYRREVTRNNLGNVTEVVIKVLYEGEYEATQKMTVEYGPDNKASRIVTSALTTDDGENMYWVDELEYKNIVWHHTDGQLITDDITSVGNGIASCVVMDSDGENNVTVDYPDAKGSFHSMLTYAAGSVEVKYDIVDNYGSYDYASTEIYREEGEDDYSYTEIERLRMNEYGLETEIYMAVSENDDPEMVMEWTKGDAVLNSDYGYPEVFTVQSLDYDTEEFINTYKIDFSNYADVSGVVNILTDESAPVEFYTIDGRPSDATAPGIYIRRQGKDVSKIVK